MNSSLVAEVDDLTQELQDRARSRTDRESIQRMNSALSDLQERVRELELLAEAAEELRESGIIDPEALGWERPTLPDENVDPDWLNTHESAELNRSLASYAKRLDKNITDAWNAVIEDLSAPTITQDLREGLQGVSSELRDILDGLEGSSRKWTSITSKRVPSTGDIERLRQLESNLEQGWEKLEEAGLTAERRQLLQRISSGGLPLTMLEGEMLEWLIDSHLAASMRIVQRT